ncbi:cytochrome c [Horticoccus luteus]|uniref:Cytochrome c n=1 Tax=Horticoccus luteus TaxID=2862869 RepID=A0A8F9TVF0_9BACT|nr:cytochrome c [Horticoccus luteus]QYM79800.1 cytochrome c [Horticoccus luteus]
MRTVYLITALIIVLGLSILGFRGRAFTKPPMDVFPEMAFPGMKYQPKYKPQGPSNFFADGRADRPLPEGVVSRDMLRSDDALYQGKDASGAFIHGFPAAVTVDLKLLQRGKERFTIYCSPCHGALGNGQGITKSYGMGATPTYHDDRLRQMPEGEIFNTITHGKGNMLSYADKLVPQDRWAVIAYVRALQRAETGTLADVPANHRSELGLK